MAEIQRQPSALVWNWRTGAGAGDYRSPGSPASAAAAARRQGAIGGAVGLAVAAVLAGFMHRTGLAAAVAALSLAVSLRAMGNLAFTRFADAGVDSYWTATEGRVHSAESYRKQF